jgi:hypothetical protein
MAELMKEQVSRAIGKLYVDVDVSEGIKNLKRLQKEIRTTLRLLKEQENKMGIDLLNKREVD